MGVEKIKNKIGIITQARTTSTRLPRKVLLEVVGKTILEHHIDRLKLSNYPVYVATSTNTTDNVIVAICENVEVPYYRGSELDVLSRYYGCAKKFDLDIIVRVTSDCPLIDGELIKEAIATYLSQPENSYLSNSLERSYPRGFDFEVFSFDALERANKNATEIFEREHVTPYIRNTEKNKNVTLMNFKRLKDASKYRITLDEEDDWKLIKELIEKYQASSKKAEEIISILETHNYLYEMNAHVEQKKI
jgi:spore coat polysaccharide biosynthesis protein SpsF